MAHGRFILSSGRESGQRGAPGGVIHGHGDCATSRVELCAVDDDSVPKTRPLGRLFSVGWHMSRCRAFLKNNRRQAQEEMIKDPAMIRGARDQISKPECGFVENCNVDGGAVCTGGLVTPSELAEHAFRGRRAGSKSVSQIVELGSPNSPSDTKRAQDNIVHRAPSGEENFILGVPESHRELGREISNTWLSTSLQNFDENDAESKSQADSGDLTYSPSTSSHGTSITTKLRVVNPSPPATLDSLHTVNLSARGIDRITPGSLPRRLHVLDLSHNEIGRIQGFRELPHLRVLNLSHNRISRIGHGLSNCTRIKELYLASNKIYKLEGFHRLLNLRVLDLSFNHLATSKCLGQLAANFRCLVALNVSGNTLLTSLGDEQLQKMVTSILPNVNFLNNQPIKALRQHGKHN